MFTRSDDLCNIVAYILIQKSLSLISYTTNYVNDKGVLYFVLHLAQLAAAFT